MTINWFLNCKTHIPCIGHILNFSKHTGVIHDYNSTASRLHFSFCSSSSSFSASTFFSLLLDHLFFIKYMVIYRKQPRSVDKFAQVSYSLPRQVCCLGLKKVDQPRRVGCQSRRIECQKSWQNDYFSLPFGFVSGSNKQSLEPTNHK